MTAAARPRRRAQVVEGRGRDPQLVKLQIAKRDLEFEDDDWRDLLERVAGARSARELSPVQKAKVLKELERLGWKPQGKQPAMEERRDLRFIHVLWKLLAEAGAVKPGRAALNAWIASPKFAAKWGDVPTDVRFLSAARAHDVIEGLKAVADRHGVELEPRR